MIQPETLAAIDDMIARVGALHSSPEVARSLLNLTKTADYDVQAVVDCLERDPAMCARVLKLVNSSRFALRRQCTNLQQAITFVGQRTLRLVAMTFSLVETLSRGAPRELYNDFWRRSLTTATIACRLAKFNKSCDANDAYTAGLLADLGILMLAQAASKEYAPIYHVAKTQGECLVTAEHAQFGFDHAMLGWRLLGDWGFPESLLKGVLWHHDTDCQESPLAVAVRGGNLMTDIIWTQPCAKVAEAMSWLDHHFGVDVDQFAELALNTREEIVAEAEIFGIDLKKDQDIGGLQRMATAQLQTAALETGIDFDRLVDSLQNAQQQAEARKPR